LETKPYELRTNEAPPIAKRETEPKKKKSVRRFPRFTGTCQNERGAHSIRSGVVDPLARRDGDTIELVPIRDSIVCDEPSNQRNTLCPSEELFALRLARLLQPRRPLIQNLSTCELAAELYPHLGGCAAKIGWRAAKVIGRGRHLTRRGRVLHDDFRTEMRERRWVRGG